MHQILVIAWREITRVRKRFGGGASPIAVVLLIIGLGLSAFALRSSVALGTGLYRVAISGINYKMQPANECPWLHRC